jgi:3-methyl-2-oxobutanoate hydroxymethyltransferase
MDNAMKKRPTVHDLRQLKGTRKFLQLHVDNALEAEAAEVSGIDLVSCEAGHTLPGIRAAAPTAFISAGLKNRTIASPEQAIRMGFEAMELGADSVYGSSSPQIIEAMAREGIPVTGHVGLVPNHAVWTGFRAIGKTPEEALKVFRALKALENAGVCAVEVEVVPVKLAAFLTRNTPVITMGMGCGTACDTQYLFSSDVLGTNTGHYPRHSK